MKEPVLLSYNQKSPLLRTTARISTQEGFCEGPVLTVYQKTETVNQTNNLLQWTFAIKADQAKGYTVQHTAAPKATLTKDLWWRGRQDGGAKWAYSSFCGGEYKGRRCTWKAWQWVGLGCLMWNSQKNQQKNYVRKKNMHYIIDDIQGNRALLLRELIIKQVKMCAPSVPLVSILHLMLGKTGCSTSIFDLCKITHFPIWVA